MVACLLRSALPATVGYFVAVFAPYHLLITTASSAPRSYPRSVVRTRFSLPLAFTSFRRTAGNDKLIVRLNKILKGRLG